MFVRYNGSFMIQTVHDVFLLTTSRIFVINGKRKYVNVQYVPVHTFDKYILNLYHNFKFQIALHEKTK